jgi:acyl-CoA hydrolase
MKITDLSQAANQVQSNTRIFFQGAAMTPLSIIQAICERYTELEKVEIVHMHTEGDAPYGRAPYQKAFRINSCFVGQNVRAAIDSPSGDYIPIFLSEIHQLFHPRHLPIDIAFIQVSPPDQHGYCSLGTSIDITLAAIASAKTVIALLNPQVPRSHGDGHIHIDQIDYGVEIDTPIYTHELPKVTETEHRIGQQVAELIEDGATLQMGIGGIPNAVLGQLGQHKDLGIHTEMFSDGILPLVEKGVITGRHKVEKQGKIVSCFAMGSQKLYDFIDDHPMIHFKEAAYTNDTAVIRRNPKVTAINSAIEIDLTGQVCADTIGTLQFSGVGGQMDFIRGASLSPGGKPIIAMASVTRKGLSKIVPTIKAGGSVTTTRAHVQYIATEYGVVNLYGKNLAQRARALISIAHPDHREALEAAAFERFGPTYF